MSPAPSALNVKASAELYHAALAKLQKFVTNDTTLPVLAKEVDLPSFWSGFEKRNGERNRDLVVLSNWQEPDNIQQIVSNLQLETSMLTIMYRRIQEKRLDEMLVPNAEYRAFATQARDLAAYLEIPLDMEHLELPRHSEHIEAQQDEEHLEAHQRLEHRPSEQAIEHAEAQHNPENSAVYRAITVRRCIMSAIAASKQQHALAVICHYFAVATRVLGPCPTEEQDEEISKEPKRPAAPRRRRMRRSIRFHATMEHILDIDEVQAEDKAKSTYASVSEQEVAVHACVV